MNEIKSLTLILHKDNSKGIKDLNRRPETLDNARERKQAVHFNIHHRLRTLGIGNKASNQQLEYYDKMLLKSKGDCQSSEETAYRMREIFTSYLSKD